MAKEHKLRWLLQNRKGLVNKYRHGKLGEILTDDFLQQLPQQLRLNFDPSRARYSKSNLLYVGDKRLSNTIFFE